MFLEQEKELILCAIRGSALIFVNDINKWKDNFKLGVYPNRMNCEYKIFIPFEDISYGECEINRDDLRLCYVDGNSAFFTKKTRTPLTLVRG